MLKVSALEVRNKLAQVLGRCLNNYSQSVSYLSRVASIGICIAHAIKNAHSIY